MNELQTIFDQCWQKLVNAAQTPGAAWRTPVLATVLANQPRQRTVVLRHADSVSGSLWIHTDLRSAKIEQITQQPAVSLLFYDPAAETQLQVRGHATVHTSGPARQQLWDSSPESSLRMYLAPQPPGIPASSPSPNLPEQFIGRVPTRADLQAGLASFAAVQIQMHS
ncbi:MAG: pyridoxamine 5'-phosphate oxidase family protein, partial [Planctomycetaceae bacterium]